MDHLVKSMFKPMKNATLVIGVVWLSLCGFATCWAQSTNMQSTNTQTPWTNSEGRIVEGKQEEPATRKVIPLPRLVSVPAVQNEIKTTELTLTPMEMGNPPIRLTQAVVPQSKTGTPVPAASLSLRPTTQPAALPAMPNTTALTTTTLTTTPLNAAKPGTTTPNATTPVVPVKPAATTNPAALSIAPEIPRQVMPKIAQSSGIPAPQAKMPQGKNRNERFLPPGSVFASPDLRPEGERQSKITLPDGAVVDLKETEAAPVHSFGQYDPLAAPVQAAPVQAAPTQVAPTQPAPATVQVQPRTMEQPVPGKTLDATFDGNAARANVPQKQKLYPQLGHNEDGTMLGNPYAISVPNDKVARCSNADYYPGQIPVNGCGGACPQRTIPAGAYGSDGWGNDGTACLDSGCCGGCYGLLRNMQFSFGVLGYSTPMDLLGQSNFGGDIALNWSTPQRWLLGLSAQAGGRLTCMSQNDINGSILTQNKGDTQFFWTSGLFYRDACSRWQFGAVYDSLNTSYFDNYTLGQVRTELSRRFGCRTDLGFLGAFRIQDSLVNWWRTNTTDYEDTITPVSWYSMFVRRHFEMGGEGTLYFGATEDSDALIGGKIEVPISDYVTLNNDFTYVFTNNDGLAGQSERSWNVSVSLTVYLSGNARDGAQNPLRPMFDVANNGTFLQTRKR